MSALNSECNVRSIRPVTFPLVPKCNIDSVIFESCKSAYNLEIKLARGLA